jgi:hypothetical protein
MKKIKFILLVPFLLAFMACDDKLDKLSIDDLPDAAAFSNEATAIGSLMGAYSRSQDLDVFGSSPQVIADFQSDNVDFVGSFPTYQDIKLFITNSANGTITASWRDSYKAILAANAVIANVDGVTDPGFTAEEKAQVIAEAKFLRSLVYFQMANLWGQPWTLDNGASDAVPLVLEPFTGEVIDFPRATVNQIYAQIITDLQSAIPNLPNSLASEGRASAGAAQGLLSRVYLYQGEWQKAADMAQNVISAGEFSLASNYSFFGGGSPSSEEVFSLINLAIDNGATGSGGWASFYVSATDGGRGDAPYSDELLAAYEAGDQRFSTLTTQALAADTRVRTFTTKFSDAINNTDNAPLIRVTEMYLNRAEALAELNGVNSESLTLINALRSRAGLSDFTSGNFSSKDDFLDAIAKERRLELAFEGHRRMDLLRRGKPLRTSGPGVGISSPGDTYVVLPIPQRELDLNTNLTQNAGY